MEPMSAVEQITPKREPMFGLLFENYPTPMWLYDLETLAFVDVNNATIQQYGYSRDEFLSMTIRDIRPEEDVARLDQHVARPRPKWQQSGEWRHRLKDGRVIDVAITSHTLEYDGRTCALVTAQDISAAKQAEAEARRYTRLYAMLSQVNQTIVRIKEREKLFARVCEVAAEHGDFLLAWIAHVERETGRIMPLAFAGAETDYLKYFTENVRTLDTMRGPTSVALREGRIAFSQDIENDPTMNNARLVALAHGFRSAASIPIRQQGDVVGALTLYSAEPNFFTEHEQAMLDEIGGDLSFALDAMQAEAERRRAEEALTQQAKTVRLQTAALEAAANAIVITDRHGMIQWANPAFSTLTGYTLQEAIGKNPRELLRSGRHEREFYRKLWGTILSGNVWQGEMINRRKDGTLYLEEQTITPVRDEHGKITHFVAIKHDVTREREMQTQAQRQERLAAVGQLAAGIAHDFNNIMAVIVLYSQMTARSPLLSDRERERLATIHDQAQHGARMIQQILDFSRRSVVERRPMDLLPLLKEHVKLLQRTLPEHIEVRFHVGPGKYIVRCDPTRIQQTIMNLAVNARDAMAAGGTLEIGLDEITVEEGQAPLPAMEAGVWVRLRVSDTGTGIPEELVERIFEPFFTTKAPGHGTGLGLAQVHGIVGEHGGHIAVDSQLGEGTTFTVYLPALPSLGDEQPMSEFDTLPRGNGERVLVVEDNAEVQTALVEVLEHLNYRAIRAADGESALKILFSHASGEGTDHTGAGIEEPIQLVLTDIVMPKMGGIDLVHALRERGYTMPVILITGHPLDANTNGLSSLGVSAWIAKPINPQQIATAISDTLYGNNRAGSTRSSGTDISGMQ
jgi:two-component system cell cycle sensor histidine kinase/response regulator CckA